MVPPTATVEAAPPTALATATELPQRRLRAVALLLNVGHAIDHMFLLIFATAVATDRGRVRLRRAGKT